MQKIRKGDEVIILTGKDRGKRGVVLNVLREKGKVVVENVGMVKRHTKGNPVQGMPGGIVEKEMPIDISNVAIWNPIINKSDRVGFRFLEDGQKVRFFKSNNEIIEI